MTLLWVLINALIKTARAGTKSWTIFERPPFAWGENTEDENELTNLRNEEDKNDRERDKDAAGGDEARRQ